MSWICANCREVNSENIMYCNACGADYQPVTSETVIASGYQISRYIQETDIIEYAGFWRRGLALLIDCIIIWIVLFVISPVVDPLSSAAAETFGKGSIKSEFIIERLMPSIILVLLGGIYYSLMESSKFQATVGKMAVGIKVTNLYNDKISFVHAFIRYISRFIYIAILPIIILITFYIGTISIYIFYGVILFGYILAAITERNQALHDKIAGTLVVKRK